MLGKMSIDLNFCNCLGSVHQLSPIVENVRQVVLDGVCLANMGAVRLKAHLTEEGPLSQAVELRCLVAMKFQLIEVAAKVVMRSSLTCLWNILILLSLGAHLDDGLLLLINFYFYFLVASLCRTGSIRVSSLYLYLLDVHWCSLRSCWIGICVVCVKILTKSVFLGLHLLAQHSSLDLTLKIMICFNFTFIFHLCFDLISNLLIPLQHLQHISGFFTW